MRYNYSRDLPSGKLLRTTISNTGSVSSTVSDARSGVESQAVVRVLTPNWKERMKILPLPINRYDFHRVTNKFGRGSSIFYDSATKTTVLTSGEMGATTSAPATSTTVVSGINAAVEAMDRTAIIALRNKMKDMRINVAQFYAERQQVSNMLAETAQKMAQAIIQLKTFNYAGAAKNLGLHVSPRSRKQKGFKKNIARDLKRQEQEIANAWLQLGYGWLPLISDAKGAAEAISKSANRFFIGRVSHTARRSFFEEKSTPLTGGWSGYNYQQNSTEISITYTVFYKLDMSPTSTAAGLGLLNPATIAWELMPWSFVIDWFIPIGDWISSLDATAGYKFSTGSKSEKTRIRNISIRTGEFRTSTSITKSQTSGSYESDRFIRSALLTMPVALFTDFKNPVSVGHWANASALLSQARHQVPRYVPKDFYI